VQTTFRLSREVIDRTLVDKDRYDLQLTGNIHADDRSRAVISADRLSIAT
jgi:hypothetical protein